MTLKKLYETIQDKNRLIQALKNNDKKAAIQAMAGTSPKTFSLTDKDFKELLRNIKFGYMDKARNILKVEKQYIPSTDHNKLNKYELEEVDEFINKFIGANIYNQDKWTDLIHELEDEYINKNKELNLKLFKTYTPSEFNDLFQILDTYYDNGSLSAQQKERIGKIYDKVFDASGR